MLEFKSLKERFEKEDDYLDFISELDDLLCCAKKEFYFLGFNSGNWDFYLTKSVNLNSDNLKVENISVTLRRALKKYIKREVEEKKPRILNNLLKGIACNQKGFLTILKIFVRKLETLEINMTEEYFRILVENSPLLAKMLKGLNIEGISFTDLKDFLEGKKVSNNFKHSGYVEKENKELFDYAISCLKNGRKIREKIEDGIIDDDCKKVLIFIRQYNSIIKIHGLFKEIIGDVDDKLLDIAILSLSNKEIDELISKYHQYTTYPIDYTFLFIISSRISKDAINFKNKKNVVAKKPDILSNTIKGPSDASKAGETEPKNRIDSSVSEDSSKKSSASRTEETRKNPINSSEDSIRKTDSSEVKEKKKVEVSSQKKHRKKTSSKKPSLEEYFPLIDGISIEERKKIVEKLFLELSLEEQNLVNNYISDIFEEDDERYRKAYHVIARMRKKYKKWGKKLLDSNYEREERIKSFEIGFPLTNSISSEKRSKIIATLISKCDGKYKSLYERYINCEIVVNSKDYYSLRSLKNILMKIYLKDGLKILEPNYVIPITRIKGRSLYIYFPVQEGMTNEERNQIVDILFAFKDEEVKNLINDYLLGKLTNRSLMGKANNYINSMKKIYQNFGKIILTPFYRPACIMTVVYSLFGITPGMTEEERNKTVDAYLDGDFYFAYAQKIFRDLNWKWKNDLTKECKKVFGDALRVIEFVYRDKMKMTRPDYYEYFKKRLIEIFTNSNRSLTEVIRKYIESETIELNQREKRVLNS